MTRKTIAIVGLGRIGSDVLSKINYKFSDRALNLLIYNRTSRRAKGTYLDEGPQLYSDYDTEEESVVGSTTKNNVRYVEDISDLSEADVVIYSVGISAANSGTKSREQVLPITGSVAKEHAQQFKAFLKRDPVIFVVTNPVDVITRIISEEYGGTVIGFGADMDSRRFRMMFTEELNNLKMEGRFDEFYKVKGFVMGSHSSNMFVAQDSVGVVKVNAEQKRYLEKLKDYSSENPVWGAYRRALDRTRTMGFDIIELTDHGSYLSVGTALSRYVGSYLFGDRPMNITGAISFDKVAQDTYLGCEEGVGSVPLRISNRNIEINESLFPLSKAEKRKFADCVRNHERLYKSLESMTPLIKGQVISSVDEIEKAKARSRMEFQELEERIFRNSSEILKISQGNVDSGEDSGEEISEPSKSSSSGDVSVPQQNKKMLDDNNKSPSSLRKRSYSDIGSSPIPQGFSDGSVIGGRGSDVAGASYPRELVSSSDETIKEVKYESGEYSPEFKKIKADSEKGNYEASQRVHFEQNTISSSPAVFDTSGNISPREASSLSQGRKKDLESSKDGGNLGGGTGEGSPHR